MFHLTEKQTNDTFGSPNAEGYVPILLHTLKTGSAPHFNLYNKVGETYILYSSGYRQFTEKQRAALVNNNVSTLYLPAEDLKNYWTYMEDNIASILDDPLLHPRKKAQVFQSTSIGLCREIITTTPEPKKIPRAKEIVQSSETLLQKGKAEFQAFVEQINRNATLTTHSLNVCTYGIALAQAIGLEKITIKKLGLGLLLHDLGMLNLPEKTITKPGPLSSSEWKLVRAHPENGLKHYKECGGMDETVQTVIYCHHEHLNGNGYPRGLSGTKIPLTARIACIANIFDALTTERPYRPALSTYNAIRTMKLELGLTIDQRLLDIFLELIKN